MDLSASSLHLLSTDHWLSERKNVEVVRLTDSPWRNVAPQIYPPAQQMSRWTSDQVVQFLKANDLEGPARVLLANGVRGQDLATLTALDLQEDLGLSRFAASRVLSARREFLQH